MKHRYFDSTTGREVDEHFACDRGVLRSGFSMRIPTMFRDAAKPLITDGHGDGGLALRRPGFRIPVNDDRRQVVADAYTRADKRASHQWKCADREALCSDCDGEGVDDEGNQCTTCGGDGVVPDDYVDRSITNEGPDNTKDHKARMERLYATHDAELSNAWRSR
jgi:hypothetical protein